MFFPKLAKLLAWFGNLSLGEKIALIELVIAIIGLVIALFALI